MKVEPAKYQKVVLEALGLHADEYRQAKNTLLKRGMDVRFFRSGKKTIPTIELTVMPLRVNGEWVLAYNLSKAECARIELWVPWFDASLALREETEYTF